MNKSQPWWLNTLVQAEECFAYWMLSRKSDKSHSFNINN